MIADEQRKPSLLLTNHTVEDLSSKYLGERGGSPARGRWRSAQVLLGQRSPRHRGLAA
jgi:hypothetical protein